MLAISLNGIALLTLLLLLLLTGAYEAAITHHKEKKQKDDDELTKVKEQLDSALKEKEAALKLVGDTKLIRVHIHR